MSIHEELRLWKKDNEFRQTLLRKLVDCSNILSNPTSYHPMLVDLAQLQAIVLREKLKHYYHS